MKQNLQAANTDDLVSAMVVLRQRLESMQVMTDRKRSDLRVLAERQLRDIEPLLQKGHMAESEVWGTNGVMVTLETVDHMNRVVDKFIQVMDAAMQTLMIDRCVREPGGMTH